MRREGEGGDGKKIRKREGRKRGGKGPKNSIRNRAQQSLKQFAGRSY